MAITFDANRKIFTIHTKQTTYQMQADANGYLLHLYYGARTKGSMNYLLCYADHGFPGIHMWQEWIVPIPWMHYRRNIHHLEQVIIVVSH